MVSLIGVYREDQPYGSLIHVILDVDVSVNPDKTKYICTYRATGDGPFPDHFSIVWEGSTLVRSITTTLRRMPLLDYYDYFCAAVEDMRMIHSANYNPRVVALADAWLEAEKDLDARRERLVSRKLKTQSNGAQKS